VGACRDDIGSNVNQGSAYIFLHGGSSWNQSAHLLAMDGTTKSYFGYTGALSADGKTILVGAIGNYIWGATPQNLGSAYVFQYAQYSVFLPLVRR
jgi:FG-GAP repeat